MEGRRGDPIEAVGEHMVGGPSGEATLPKVLVVDDDQDTRVPLAEILRAEGFDVVVAADREAAVDRVAAAAPSIVLLDLVTPRAGGIETLRRLKMIAPNVPVIVLTEYGDTVSGIQAMKLGAYDHLAKSAQTDEILGTVRRSLERRREPEAEIEEPTDQLREHGSLRWLMGPSGLVRDVIEQIRQVADSNLTIFIQGETGTGKELVARAIHQMSSRRDKPFLALDCGAAPEMVIESELFGYEKGVLSGADRRKNGYFQLAAGGSLFFDGIANLPLTTQAKLLRALQDHRVQRLGGRRGVPLNVRILAAHTVPVVEEIRTGRFRQDLYYGLTEFVIVLPPLRERREDIAYLAERFLTEASIELRRPVRGISNEALELLMRYSWPGNVRELRNVLRRAVVLSSDLVRPDHVVGLISETSRPAMPATTAPDPVPLVGLGLKEIAHTAAAGAENRAIRQVLQTTHGKKSEAARLLKVDYKTLHLKMKRYGIYSRDFMA